MPAVSANFTLSESDGSATAFLVKGRRGKLDRNRFAFRGFLVKGRRGKLDRNRFAFRGSGVIKFI